MLRGAADLSTFVLVGNVRRPFTRLLDAVTTNAAALPQPVIVQHGHTPFKSDACRGVPFLEMSEFERLIASSQLVIAHAGVGGIFHALRAGKVPVVVPRRSDLGEHLDDHQLSLARALSKTQKVVVVEDVGTLLAGSREALAHQEAYGSSLREVPMVELVADALRKS
jgi:UDP-N-acetylglucosamine transferase subunit ALG13